MVIDRMEKIMLGIGVAMMGLALIAIGYSVFVQNIHLPQPAGRVDVRAAAQTAPFDTPGFVETEPGKYDATLLAFRYGYSGFDYDSDSQTFFKELPVGSEVTFELTSTDVIHGFMITDTTINSMVIPGQVTRVTHTFTRPGEYLVICHEYCGSQHHVMYAKVIIV